MSARKSTPRQPSWPCSTGDVIRYLAECGFTGVRTPGGEQRFSKGPGRVVAIPNHRRLARSTYEAVIRVTAL